VSKKQRPKPIVYVKVGNHLVPIPRFLRLFHQQWAEGEEVILDVLLQRSMASHNHYFAALHEGFLNLAEEYAQEFDSEEHLRHWCLCKEGFCTSTKWVMNTAEDARQLRKALKEADAATIVGVEGNVATVYHPLSQSMKAMGKDAFEESKKAVLARVASMANTTVTELKKNAGRAA